MGLRDFTVLVFVIVCISFAMRKAWYGVLALAVFSYLNPHAYAWGFVRTLPLFQILFLAVAFKTFITDDRQAIPKDWRVSAFVLLWIIFFLSTTQAYYQEAAWDKYWFVTKIYIPFFFTLVLINTREKLFYLITTIACSIGIVAVKGGAFALLSGFSYRVYGPPSTQFEENNAFAIAVLINIPLLILLYRETTKQWIKMGVTVAIPLHFASALSSWSRGALLSMGVMILILLWHSKRKYLIVPVLLIGAYLVFQYLPTQWFDRMGTINTYEDDLSAMGRITAWKDGWNHTLEHPFLGAGFEGWRWVTQRDWHSSIVEMFSEHGFIAFGLWISMIIGTLINLSRLPKMASGIPEMKWVSNYSHMLRTSLIVYLTGTAFLGLSYWDLLYHLIFISVLLRHFTISEIELSGKHNKDIDNVIPPKKNRIWK